MFDWCIIRFDTHTAVDACLFLEFIDMILLSKNGLH